MNGRISKQVRTTAQAVWVNAVRERLTMGPDGKPDPNSFLQAIQQVPSAKSIGRKIKRAYHQHRKGV